jgi:hypothetical protein
MRKKQSISPKGGLFGVRLLRFCNWLSIGVSMYPTVVERIRGRLYKPQVTLVSQIPIYFSSSRSYPRSTQKLEQKVEQDAPG